MKQKITKVALVAVMSLSAVSGYAEDNAHSINNEELGWVGGIVSAAAMTGAGFGYAHYDKKDRELVGRANSSAANADSIVSSATKPYREQTDELSNRITRLKSEVKFEKEKFEVLRKRPTHGTVQTETVAVAHLNDTNVRSRFFGPQVSAEAVDAASDVVTMQGPLNKEALDQAKRVKSLELRLTNLEHQRAILANKIAEARPFLSSGLKGSFLTEADRKQLSPHIGSYQAAEAKTSGLMDEAWLMGKKANQAVNRGVGSAISAIPTVFAGYYSFQAARSAAIADRREKAQAAQEPGSPSREPAQSTADGAAR